MCHRLDVNHSVDSPCWQAKLFTLPTKELSEFAPDISGSASLASPGDGRNPAKEKSTNRLGDG